MDRDMEGNLLDRESTHDTAVERNDFHQASTHGTPVPENSFQSLGLPENTEIIPGLLATKRALRSALANMQQYNALQNKTKMAHVLGLPLLSDALAHKIADLLIQPQPQIVEADTAAEKEEICWLDLIWEPELEPRRHNDETYYCRIKKCNALIELSAWDYDLVFTCRQLLRTQTYLCDLLTERKALDSMAKALSSYEQIASDIIDTGKEALLHITGKLQAVEESLSRLSRTPQVPDSGFRRNSIHEEETTLRRSETADESAVEDVKEEGFPHSRRLRRGDLERLPAWFQDHDHLSDDTIEEEFEKDFHQYRSCGAIRAAVKRQEGMNALRCGQRKKSARRCKSKGL